MRLRTFCSLRFTAFGYTNDVISFFFFSVLSGIRKRQEGNGSVSYKGTHPHRAFVIHLLFLSSKNCNFSTVGSAYSYKNLTVGLKKCVQIPHPCRGLRYLRLRTFLSLRFTAFGYTNVSFLSFFFLVLSGIRKRQEGNGSVSSKGTHPHRAFFRGIITT